MVNKKKKKKKEKKKKKNLRALLGPFPGGPLPGGWGGPGGPLPGAPGGAEGFDDADGLPPIFWCLQIKFWKFKK